MRHINIISYIVISICIGMGHRAHAEYASRRYRCDDKKMEIYGPKELLKDKANNVVYPTVSLPIKASLLDMRFDPSPSNRLMYVEKNEKPESMPSLFEYCYASGGENGLKLSKPYLDTPVYTLHVVDKDGKEYYNIPLKYKDTTIGINEGAFYGEHWVGLMVGGRQIGRGFEQFIHLDTGKSYSLEYFKMHKWYNYPFPDGSGLITLTAGCVYLNGKTVYPYNDPDPLGVNVSPQEFEQRNKEVARKYVERAEAIKKEEPLAYLEGYINVHELNALIWFPDGKSFLILGDDQRSYYRIWIDGCESSSWSIDDHYARIPLSDFPGDWLRNALGDYEMKLDAENNEIEFTHYESHWEHGGGKSWQVKTPKVIKTIKIPGEPQASVGPQPIQYGAVADSDAIDANDEMK